VPVLPPTSPNLADDGQRPYFLWWADVTCADFRRKLKEGTPDERGYWLGALLREANTRDVWLFTTVAEITELWPAAYRHLGQAKALWRFLLKLPAPEPTGHAS